MIITERGKQNVKNDIFFFLDNYYYYFFNIIYSSDSPISRLKISINIDLAIIEIKVLHGENFR